MEAFICRDVLNKIYSSSRDVLRDLHGFMERIKTLNMKLYLRTLLRAEDGACCA